MIKNNEQLATELTDKILGLLMEKNINKMTYGLYKDKIYELILDYLKSNS